MLRDAAELSAKTGSKTYPLGEQGEHFGDGNAMAVLSLSHTPLEHRLYTAMLAANLGKGITTVDLSTRRLMDLTGIRSHSTVRRGLEGLLAKLSIERRQVDNGNHSRHHDYFIHRPEQIIARRSALGLALTTRGLTGHNGNRSFERALRRVAENSELSRREAQVALCCIEGLTNAEIGRRLQVTEQTVKFHLRHVFIKFGVRRRAELISRLLI